MVMLEVTEKSICTILEVYDYEVIKIEDGKVLIFHAAMNMTVGDEKRIRVI